MTMAISTRERIAHRSRSRDAIAIVGGGAAGTLAAIHLVEAAAAPEIVLIERAAAIGEGVAYSSRDERHLLNVSADRMSAYGDDPGHFARWLDQSDRPKPGPDAFAPRFRFAEYLRDTLSRSAARRIDSVRLETVRGRADAVHTTAAGIEIVLADRSTIDVRRLVLAIGHATPHWPWSNTPRPLERGRYVPDPWVAGALDHIGEGARVVLAGTGLTMVDVAVTLASRGVGLDAVSRHGLLPRAHARERSSDQSDDWSSGVRLVDLLREVRARSAAAVSWQATIDSLRPRAQELWRCSSFEAQSQFLRHLRRYWEVHRHRMAPAVAAQVAELMTTGELRVHAGFVDAVVETSDDIVVGLRGRAHEESVTLRADYLVNCTGPVDRIDLDPQPLVASLFQQGLAQPDVHGLGLAVTEWGEIIGAREARGSLFALGGLRRGTLWETTGVPEIRAQAEALASLIARRTRSGDPVSTSSLGTKRPKERRK